jgi:hypothetical protein
MNIRNIALIALLFGATIGLAAVTSSTTGDLMKKKTEHAQNILKYLALGDLASVKSEADKLEKLTTEAGFEDKSETYAEYGKEFLRLVRDLSKDAGNENLAGSYYQFTRMTSVCFSCHEHIRDAAKQR